MQLRQSLKRPVDRLVCVAIDSDESLDLLPRVFREQSTDVAAGIKLLTELVGAKCQIIDVAYTNRFSGYPSLEPSLLIHNLFSRRVRMHAPSTDVGVMLVDVIAAAQLGRLTRDQPIGDLPVVVDDHLNQQRIRIDVPGVTTVASVMEKSKIEVLPIRIHHGPAMQQRIIDLSMPISATELWLHVFGCDAPPVPAACTRCGECVTVCPVLLQPAALLEASQKSDATMGARFKLRSCIECGLCDSVCPSHLPILHGIRHLKAIAS